MAKQKLLTAAIRKQMPALYEQEDKGDEAKAYVKFFTPWTSWTWWATEASAFVEIDGETEQVALKELTDKGPFGFFYQDHPIEDIRFFGLVDGHDKEQGYFSYNELAAIRGRFGLRIERDIHYTPKTMSELL